IAEQVDQELVQLVFLGEPAMAADVEAEAIPHLGPGQATDHGRLLEHLDRPARSRQREPCRQAGRPGPENDHGPHARHHPPPAWLLPFTADYPSTPNRDG